MEVAMSLCTPNPIQRPIAGGAWPKMLFHAQLASQGRVFQSEEEFLRCDEPGWSEIPPGKEEVISRGRQDEEEAKIQAEAEQEVEMK